MCFRPSLEENYQTSLLSVKGGSTRSQEEMDVGFQTGGELPAELHHSPEPVRPSLKDSCKFFTVFFGTKDQVSTFWLPGSFVLFFQQVEPLVHWHWTA